MLLKLGEERQAILPGASVCKQVKQAKRGCIVGSDIGRMGCKQTAER